MLSVSLPFGALAEGTGLGSDAFLDALAEKGVRSIELRVVFPNVEAETVKQVAERISRHGLRFSVHTVPFTADSAVRDIFTPLQAMLASELQENTVLVLHPVNGSDLLSENRRMMAALTDHVRKNALSVKLALENNRRMPDRSEGDSAALVMHVIQDADPAYAGLTFDFGHYAWATRVWETESPKLPPEAFSSRVIHTHIHALAGAERRYTTHFPLQIASLPLREYLDAIRPGYTGVLNLELEPERFPELMRGEDAILGSVDVLKQVDF